MRRLIKGRLLLFAGDITNSKQDLLQNAPKSWLYSSLIVPEDTVRTQRLREWLGALDRQACTRWLLPTI